MVEEANVELEVPQSVEVRVGRVEVSREEGCQQHEPSSGESSHIGAEQRVSDDSDATRLVDEGLVWPTRRTCWRGKEVFKRTYDNPGGRGKFPHFTSVLQVRTEAYVHEALDEAGIDIHWNCAVETVESSPDGVSVETSDGREWETPYLVGTDGGGSTVRDEIGAVFEGDQSKNSFIIADVDELEDEDDQWLLERLFHYDDPDVGGRNVILVPFTGGWRLDI